MQPCIPFHTACAVGYYLSPSGLGAWSSYYIRVVRANYRVLTCPPPPPTIHPSASCTTRFASRVFPCDGKLLTAEQAAQAREGTSS
ncbi:MAG: hypothetical protein ABSH44_16800 [Bryobacteraceae bacterium]|jgi:hypothetical protein